MRKPRSGWLGSYPTTSLSRHWPRRETIWRMGGGPRRVWATRDISKGRCNVRRVRFTPTRPTNLNHSMPRWDACVTDKKNKYFKKTTVFSCASLPSHALNVPGHYQSCVALFLEKKKLKSKHLFENASPSFAFSVADLISTLDLSHPKFGYAPGPRTIPMVLIDVCLAKFTFQ